MNRVVPFLAVAMSSVAEWEAKGDADGQQVISALGALDEALTPHLDDEEQ